MAHFTDRETFPVHPWLLIFRFAQLFFAILVTATTAFPLSIFSGGPIQPPLISTLVVACVTIILILPLTTPLHISQRRLYDPRLSFLLDVVAVLFWLGTFAALVSYQVIFKSYGSEDALADIVIDLCEQCRGAWRSGVAATVFAGLEFLLFLCTTFVFVYYYHGGPSTDLASVHGSNMRKVEDGAHHSKTGAVTEAHTLSSNHTPGCYESPHMTTGPPPTFGQAPMRSNPLGANPYTPMPNTSGSTPKRAIPEQDLPYPTSPQRSRRLDEHREGIGGSRGFSKAMTVMGIENSS